MALAKRQRRNSTEAEARTWAILRGRGCLGLKFRRQHVICGFIVDFYCARHRLALEVDGNTHEGGERGAYDAERTRVLNAAGVAVLRISNEEVALPRLRELLEGHLARSPSPFHGEGERG